jgi:hypothetical protein
MREFKMFRNLAPNTLYHYTTVGGLIGIFRDKKIWATNVNHLNDRKEFSHAIDMFKEKYNTSGTLDPYSQRLLNEISEITYVCSFSECGDLLSQWRGYCPSGGFSIGFDYRKLLKLKESTVKKGTLTEFSKCIYEENAQADKMDEILKKYGPNSKKFGSLIGEISMIAPTFKHPSFCDEREWRLVLSVANFNMKFREGKTTIIPYYEFDLEENAPLPINSIIIGPTPNERESILAVKLLLRKHGMSEEIVNTSKIPYREL